MKNYYKVKFLPKIIMCQQQLNKLMRKFQAKKVGGLATFSNYTQPI